MTRHEPGVALLRMRDFAQLARQFAEGDLRADLDTDVQLRFSMVYALQSVGEAARRLSRDEQAVYPGIPWSEIVGLRHRVVHGNDNINLDRRRVAASARCPRRNPRAGMSGVSSIRWGTASDGERIPARANGHH